MVAVDYLKRRLGERSTWAAVGMTITAGAAVSAPWSYVLIGCGVVGVLIPTSTPDAGAQ